MTTWEADAIPVTASIDGPLFAGRPAQAAPSPFSRSTIQPTGDERIVAAMIWERKGRARPISIAHLADCCGISERQVKGIVEQLRVSHRCAIGASRQEPNGYYWIVDAEDQAAAVAPYKAQILSMWRTLRVLDDAHSLRELLGQLRLED